MGTKDFAGALRHFETALFIREQALGTTHLKLAGDLGGMASALLALDRRDDAVKALERIVSLRASDAAHPGELARAEVTLAKELFVLSPKRARVVLQSADAHFAAAGEPLAEERAAAKAWLSAQPR
jgi:hypothetical protein